MRLTARALDGRLWMGNSSKKRPSAARFQRGALHVMSANGTTYLPGHCYDQVNERSKLRLVDKSSTVSFFKASSAAAKSFTEMAI